jgi:tetratricopeptide (TPR) repeat protein
MLFRPKPNACWPFPLPEMARFVLILSIFGSLSAGADTNSAAAIPAPTQSQASNLYIVARSNYVAQAGNTTSAWRFAEACFERAEYATNDTQRAAFAEEGIAAARFATEMDPKSAPAHFYLAMNKGQLARTRSLTALTLVKEMEESFLRSLKLDPTFDYAAAHRSLGMLYLDAPRWPASIGNKSKARKHLEKAVELAPDYPTNHLTLMDAYLRWGDKSPLTTAMNRYRRILPKVQEKYAGDRWQSSWRNWNADWQKVVQKSLEL